MAIDEFYCHQRRELRRWERLGHPADTLLFASCFVYMYLVEPMGDAWIGLVALSVLSSLFITKDEWQHKELCSGFENWLHSLLFILHPIVLIWAGWLWWHHSGNTPIIMMMCTSSLFFVYQTIYWNLWRRD